MPTKSNLIVTNINNVTVPSPRGQAGKGSRTGSPRSRPVTLFSLVVRTKKDVNGIEGPGIPHPARSRLHILRVWMRAANTTVRHC